MIPTFNYASFIAAYPMYSMNPSEAVVTNLWNEVGVMGSPIISSVIVAQQSYYYYVVLAHLVELWIRGPGANGITNSSSQGTVSVGFAVDQSPSLLWWNQTSWGAKIANLIKMRGGFRFIYGGQNYRDIYN